ILPGDRDDGLPLQVLPFRPAARRDGQLDLFPRAKRAVRVAREIGWARQWLRFGWRGTRWERNPEKAARRVLFRLASKAMPRAMRDAVGAARPPRHRCTPSLAAAGGRWARRASRLGVFEQLLRWAACLKSSGNTGVTG